MGDKKAQVRRKGDMDCTCTQEEGDTHTPSRSEKQKEGENVHEHSCSIQKEGQRPVLRDYWGGKEN